MGENIQLVIVVMVVAAAVAGLLHRLLKRTPKDKGCAGCPLKDNCGKRSVIPRSNDGAPCGRN